MAIPGNFLSESTSSMDPAITGWTPKTNCTLLMGTGGRVGDGCLTMRSVASSEMQCRTVASYPVIAGSDYQVFADAAGATVPERIGIRWLTSANAEISISWSLTTSSASASWHRIAVTATAPATAVSAQVLFSSTPAAGAVSSYLENVYLGLPIRTVGNLLTHGAEGHEQASNWPYATVSNCSVTRTVPPVSWPTINYVGGGTVATMTVTANGDASFRCTEQSTVTPGQEYMASSHLNPPTSGSTAWIELRFYDAAHSQIQATRANLAAPGTNYYMQSVSAVAPAAAAFASVAFGLTGATAGQVLRTDTSAITLPPVLVAGSVVPYADASFEAGVGSFTVVSGAATLGRTSPWAPSIDAFYAMTITSATATTSVVRSGRYPIPAGNSFRSSFSTTVTAGGWNLTLGLRWYNAANTDLGLTAASVIPAPTPGWWTLSNDFAPLVGATQVAFEWTLAATSPASVMRVDKAAIRPALPQFEADPDDATASVQVAIRELNLGDALTLWRVTPDGRRTLVRGTGGLLNSVVITSESMIVEDYEAPLGVPLYYYFESLAVGAPAPANGTTNDLVTIVLADSNEAWLKDPGNPQRNVRVLVRAAPDWQRPIAQAEYRVRGRRNSVTHSDVRGGLEGTLTVWTRSDEEREALHWLLDTGNVLLWQAMPGMGVSDMYVNVGDAGEARVSPYAPEPWREWPLPLREADRPTAIGVAGSAGRTWQDVLTEHATWDDVLAKYATWEDVFLNRPIGG